MVRKVPGVGLELQLEGAGAAVRARAHITEVCDEWGLLPSPTPTPTPYL